MPSGLFGKVLYTTPIKPLDWGMEALLACAFGLGCRWGLGLLGHWAIGFIGFRIMGCLVSDLDFSLSLRERERERESCNTA